MIKIEAKGNYLFVTNLETNEIFSTGKGRCEFQKNADGTFDLVINDNVIFDNKQANFFVDENEVAFDSTTLVDFYTLNSAFNPASSESLAVVEQNLSDLQNQVDNLNLIENHSELTLDDGTNPHGTTKADVGLSNVDNTSDANKPVSTATQTALNGKQDSLFSGTNIKTINGQSVLGSGDLIIVSETLNNVVYVNSLSDLPTPVADVITLASSTNYIFNSGTFAFGSNRIVLSNNSMLYGLGKTNTILTYSGGGNFISGTNVNSNIWDIEFQATGNLFNISNTSSQSLYFKQLNFRNCTSLGSIVGGGIFAEYTLAITCGNGLSYTGNGASVVFDTCSFRNMTGGSNSYGIKVETGSTGNSFRVYNSIFDVASSHYGIWIAGTYTLTSGGIIKGNVFSGLGTRLSGVNGASAGWTIIHEENIGISGLQFIDIEINTTDATLGNSAGNYIDGGSVKGFALNIANYDPLASVMQAKVSALFTTTATIEVGVRNHTDSLNIIGTSAPTSGTNTIIESPFVTITSGKEYTGYYVKTNGSGTTRKSLKLTLKIY